MRKISKKKNFFWEFSFFPESKVIFSRTRKCYFALINVAIIYEVIWCESAFFGYSTNVEGNKISKIRIILIHHSPHSKFFTPHWKDCNLLIILSKIEMMSGKEVFPSSPIHQSTIYYQLFKCYNATKWSGLIQA